MSNDGFVNINNLVEYCNSQNRFTAYELLKEVVELDDKQRFSLNEDGSMIRAIQSHSIEINIDLK